MTARNFIRTPAQKAPGARTMALTGAVSRTTISVTQDWVNAKEFGITYDGSDEGAKLNAAIAALAGSSTKQLVLTGRVSSSVQITVAPNDINILGAGGGSRRSGIIALDNSIVTLSVSGARCSIDNILLYGPPAPTSSNMGIYWSGVNGRIRDVDVISMYSGTAAANAHDLHTHNLQNLTYTGFGFSSAGCIGGWHSKMRNVAGSAGLDTRGTLGNVRLVNQNESVNFTDMECLAGKYSIIVVTSNPDQGTRTFASHFTNCFFDGATHGSELHDLYGSSFTGCWFSGGREGNTHGLLVERGRAIDFDHCQWYNCGTAGMRAFYTRGLNISGGQAHDNAKTSTGFGGIDLNGVNYFSVRGVYTGNGIVNAYGSWPDGRQVYGVTVQADCTNGRVKDIMNDGNLTGAVFAGAAASSTMVYADNF